MLLNLYCAFLSNRLNISRFEKRSKYLVVKKTNKIKRREETEKEILLPSVMG